MCYDLRKALKVFKSFKRKTKQEKITKNNRIYIFSVIFSQKRILTNEGMILKKLNKKS